MAGKPNSAAEFPPTVDSAVSVLLNMVPKVELQKIAEMGEDGLVNLHFGLGMWIRNNFGLWSGNKALLRSAGALLPDDAAAAIIRALWQKLQDEKPKIH